MGLVPKTTESEQKISLSFFTLSLKRIVGFFATFMIAAVFSKLMPKAISILFIIFMLILYFWLTGSSASNPQKKFYQSLADYWFYLTSPKKIYSEQSDEWKKSEKTRKEIADAKHKKKKTDSSE